MTEQTFGIVGAGIVGLAIGRELTRRYPGARIVVFEKEDRVGAHQTGHNSGVVHAGIYYQPGSLKAELCTRGRLLLRDYCAEVGLPYRECGKLVVAVDLFRGGTAEQSGGDRRGRTRCPACGGFSVCRDRRGRAACRRPHGPAFTRHRHHRLRGRGPSVRRGDSRRAADAFCCRRRSAGCGPALERRGHVARCRHPIPFDRLVLCAGLQADRVSQLADGDRGPRIVPFRGEYMAVDRAKRDLVRGMIYPVPDPRYPFLGVHFTRRVSGELEVGPNAVLALRREGYGRAGVKPARRTQHPRLAGFWRMAARHWRTGITELRGSLSVRAYMRTAAALRARDRPGRRRSGGSRGPRTSRRPGRLPGRRLPDQSERADHQRPQRTLARRDLEPGHSRIRR